MLTNVMRNRTATTADQLAVKHDILQRRTMTQTRASYIRRRLDAVACTYCSRLSYPRNPHFSSHTLPNRRHKFHTNAIH